ncbi:MAG: type II secretion system protein GspM [Lamprobacter sp.]|uniref:type II secretion system protein GspM n=1 Tax=Lamprobacter sp. TaxID=3100796 RepID=UPI002B2602FF|nr:type II secretion system protein GspM [Lamprobacter sp.]MEA3638345.1 type II secretion system protein GspM [Lamprobacter sp.]
MSITWSPRSTCNLLLVMMLLLPISLVLMIGLGWFSKLQTVDDNIERDLIRLQRYRGIAASLPALRQALDAEQSNDAFKAFYFDADTPGLAGAQLQTQVQEMVRTAGARPISTQILPTSDEDDPPKVSVRIQLQGTTDQLLDLLYRVESARPFLLVDQLSIRSQARSTAGGPQRVARGPRIPDNQEQLTVRLDIFGYFLRPTG